MASKPWRRSIAVLAAGTAIGLVAGSCTAQSASGLKPPTWEITLSPYALHWSNDEHHKNVYALGVERQEVDDALWGGMVFRNSFGQASAYAYYGHQWNGVLGHPNLYVKISAGVVYGYTGEYKDKVPLNVEGFAPAIIPAVGYRFTRHDALQIAIFGSGGLLFSYARRF